MRMENPLLLPPLTLAYLGDSVYERFVRERMLERGIVKVKDLHKESLRYVRAGAQAGVLEKIWSDLSEEEQDVVRRGRNAKGHAAPKGSDAAEYSASTGFEALIGYLYLADRPERLQQLLVDVAKRVEE